MVRRSLRLSVVPRFSFAPFLGWTETDDGHLAQNKERHAGRFTRFKYCWERLTPQASVMLLKEPRAVCCFVSLLLKRLGMFGRKRTISGKIVG